MSGVNRRPVWVKLWRRVGQAVAGRPMIGVEKWVKLWRDPGLQDQVSLENHSPGFFKFPVHFRGRLEGDRS